MMSPLFFVYSELWDRVMLTSTSIPPKGAGATCHYAAAVFKDG